MCEIYGYAELEDEYTNDLFKKETPAEINGSKRKVAILQNQDNLGSSIFALSTKLTASKSNMIKPTKVSGEVVAEVTIKWGGSEGVKTTYNARVEATDNKGNRTRIDYERDEKGESQAHISTAHKSERD